MYGAALFCVKIFYHHPLSVVPKIPSGSIVVELFELSIFSLLPTDHLNYSSINLMLTSQPIKNLNNELLRLLGCSTFSITVLLMYYLNFVMFFVNGFSNASVHSYLAASTRQGW
jgi:hypothetical protein